MSIKAEEYTRLVNLETRFVHTEHLLQDLSDVIRQQWGEIDKLTALVNKLDDRIAELEHRPNMPDGPGREKPPHY